jgi:hypothetical protein
MLREYQMELITLIMRVAEILTNKKLRVRKIKIKQVVVMI